MPVKTHELPRFLPTFILQRMLKVSPGSYLEAEQSSFFRLMSSAYDPRAGLQLFEETAAEMWRVFWEENHEWLDTLIPDPDPGASLHKLRPENLLIAQGQAIAALGTRFDSAFEMFGLEEYEQVTRGGAAAVPMSVLLPALYSQRPTVAELEAVPREHRNQAISLLQDDFSIDDAYLWNTLYRSQLKTGNPKKNTTDQDRERFAALRGLDVPAADAIGYLLHFPEMPVWKMVAVYNSGIPVEYAQSL